MTCQGDIALVPACGDARLREVAALARAIWQEHYPGIISQAQIDYMLARGYNLAAMRADIANGMRYVLARDGAHKGASAVAFAGHAPDPQDAGTLWLHKFYVASSARRRGVGRRLLDDARAHARELGRPSIRLRVNRQNRRALAVYDRLGFVIEAADVADIGGGFVMDDYVMRRAR